MDHLCCAELSMREESPIGLFSSSARAPNIMKGVLSFRPKDGGDGSWNPLVEELAGCVDLLQKLTRAHAWYRCKVFLLFHGAAGSTREVRLGYFPMNDKWTCKCLASNIAVEVWPLAKTLEGDVH